jgi:hypothetical protein
MAGALCAEAKNFKSNLPRRGIIRLSEVIRA